MLNINAYPEPGLTWMHPSGREIDFTQLKKYELDVSEDSDVVKLSVDHVELEDTGEYLLNVEVQVSQSVLVKCRRTKLSG